MSEFRTLVDLIETRKNEEQIGITFILGEKDERFISYKQMYMTSLKLLNVLQKAGYRQGDEVIFQIEDNEQFVYSFWACILGGMLPVPVPTGEKDDQKFKLFKIWSVLNHPRILISDNLLDALESFAEKNGLSEKAELFRRNAVFINKIDLKSESSGEIYNPKPEDIAFIQFSSGSTGDPKGVMITHNNVFVNLNSVLRYDQYTKDDVSLSWLPLTHDMGLIGFHIKEVLADIKQYYMATQLFLSQPILWMQKVSEHKVSVLYSPNFGYKQVLKYYNPDIRQNWDLSRVRIIYNGAEPTSLDVNNEFLDKMSVYGLRRCAMRPVYGLAESTIAVSFPKLGEEFISHVLDRNHLGVGETVVDTTIENINAAVYLDVGYPIYDCYVRITNEDNEDIGENKIGFVQISGGNVTSGYYNNKEATGEAITPDGWFNTGDLGFLRNKRLTITGRAKDVIFVAGQNFYSQDIERLGENVEGVEFGKIVAVGVYNDRRNCDELVLFVKFEDKVENFISIVANLKKEISQKNGVEVSEVIPVREIPKTSSGKLQRFKLRENYLSGEYDSAKSRIHALMSDKYSVREIVKAVTPVQKDLVVIWSHILDNDKIGISDDFFTLGGDSLTATQVISRIKEHFQIDINQSEIFGNSTIESLAKVIENAVKSKDSKDDEIKAVTKGLEKTQLSYAQQRLWFLDRLNLNSSQYNLSKGLVLKGKLDIEALKKSFNAILKHHKVLQACFVEENGEPVQIFNSDIEMPMKFTDMRGVPDKDKKAKITELAVKETKVPFDLEKAPLFKGNLICCDENEHVLILVVHHIVFDGWSFGILLKELNFYYRKFVSGSEETLPELKIQYADYAIWQKDNIENARFKNQLEFWKEHLGGSLPALDLPLDKPRPAIQTYDGAKFTSYIPVEVTDELQKYARKENTTLFMVLLAAFKVLLYKYSGQTDIIVGSPIASRNNNNIEDLIGFFTNDIILRTSFSNEMKFSELLQKVKQVTVDAYSNQDIPFEKIVEELRIERDLSKNPIFQVLFGMQNTPMPDMELPELDVSIMDIDGGYARFDLAVDIQIEGEGLAADFEYNTDLFNEDTIVRMAGHFNQLLAGIIKNPGLALDDYEVLTNKEKKTILSDWNATKEDLPEIASWTQLFEKQAALTPDALAAVCAEEQMTYAQLNESSNKIAHYLQSLGVGTESIVGVYIDRSINMLAALLGVQKSGAAYLPMDPIYPKERLAYMLGDAKADAILTEKNLADSLPANDARVICLDSDDGAISKCSSENIAPAKTTNNLAYAIYTSGSTGKPKGVQIEQHALINLLLSFAKKTEMSKKDTLLAVTTLSFDIAGLELYMPLICGAKVIIAQRDDVTDGEKLISMLKQYSVTMMQATPATWRLLIEAGWSGSAGLTVLCGGEALPKGLADQLLSRCSTLINVYGPTETTIWSTMDIVKPGSDTILIGRPIANTRVYVVDNSMNPVPIGVPGELLIGGDGLARGYKNLPEMTADRFIPDKFSKNPNDRLYKTGDVVRFTSDGKLECIGRKDHQVKIRGFRIELGEIESLINMEQSVKEGIVVAKELVPGEKSLVAYIIPASDDIDTEKIRGKLKEKLPHYMVPSFFMTMESFPMTPNGKIDRKALPLPQRKTAKATESFAADVNNVEGQVKEIWKEVLNLDDLDVNGNFFDLGGHSLLMAQVRSRIKNRLNKDVSMMDLFKYPTVASLAAYLSGNSAKDNGNEYRKSGSQRTSKIAIIGMSGRFPGAKNLKEFWDNLCGGVNSITRFTEEEVIEAGVSPETVKKSGYVKAWGTLEDIDLFDAQFFGYNPREAEVLDPQQRIFLEESWKAIEDAGYDTEKFKGSVGVFGSVGRNSYAKNLESGNDSKGLANDYQIMISNDKDFLATRIGYKLNLEGPCLSVQTACSSSLVALHLACRSLINGECDMALAGGVSIRIPQKTGYLYQEGMILSPDGDCRAFDDDSKGTVGGNGAGVVVLKRYEDAVADGDNISAVILGSAINNDGAMKIGYTAPRVDGQAKAIAKAQEAAGIDPESVTYIEAHGTGTPLGDPIEIEALTSAFRKGTDKKDFCAIGSVKTNIGHLDAAAGVAGLIKTVLALRSRMLPPSLNFKSPNKKIDFKESPFFVNNSLNEWKNGNKPLRAGVSAFGIGGTNAHVVLEEAPEIISDADQNKPMLFVMSAKNKKALDNIAANLAEFFESNRNINLADAAYTLQMGRREFEHRRFFIASTVDEAIELLKDADKHSDKVFDSADGKIGGISQTIDKPEEKTLDEIGRLWLNGASVNWADLYTGQRRKRVSLPTYPFEGRSFWVKKSVQPSLQAPALKNKKNDVAEWFYSPIWKQSVENREDVDSDISKGILLVLKDSGEFSDAFEAGLRERGANIISAVSGSEHKQTGDGKFTFDPENPEHYEKLIGEIAKTGKTPVRIANMLGLEKTENRLYFGERLFYSMMYTAQAIGKNGELPVEMRAITGNTQRIFNETQLNPENALHLGACRVISTEYGNIKCCSVDLNLVEDENNQELAELLIDELYFMPCDGTVAYRGLERWKQDYEKMPLKENGRGIKFKDGGVYVITGGMGGIGLITAQNISYEVPNAKLVLVGRSGFPEQSEWDSWLDSHGRRDHASQKILKMKELISAGAEVFTVKADVTQKDQVGIMRKTIIDRFGRVDGIIHAAGRPGGGMIQMKKKEQAEEVLKPKVYGAVNLYEVFKDSDIDFMIFYSSLNAITGGFGQIDYSAANAFMDAFAQAHDSRRGTRYISVDWDRWPGTGMAVSASQGSETQEEVHPLLGRCILDNDEKTVYSSLMSPEKDWVLSEHLVLGTPTIAGTTYLEMARAAYEDITGNSRAVISNVLFLNPLAVKEGEKRDVFTVMTKNGNAYNFAIISKGSEKQKDNADWTEHIHGTIAPGEGESKDSFRIDDLKQKCSLKNIYSESGSQSISEKFISFGGRWRSLKNYSVSDSEGLVEVQLNDSFAGDMENFKMHPSILDVATGALRLTAKGNYLPFSYGKLEIFDTLPAKIYGYIRFKSGFDTAAEIITSDIDILSESGEQLIKITNFSMKLVSEASAEHIKNRNGAAHENSAVTEYVINILNSREGGFLQEGIAVPEGLKAMRIIMKGCFKPQVIVSTKDIDYAIEQSNYIAQPNFKSTMLEAAAAKARHPRPEVESEYVPPKKDIEKKLVNIWEDVLSIDKVGIHDDFFALGGDSLLLIQLHSTLKENFETDFAVVDLYKYNTVALLAKYLSGGNAEDEQPAFEEVNSRVNKQRELMKKRRQNMMRRKGVNFNE